LIRARNETLPVAAARISNPERFARWNQSLKRSPTTNGLF